MTGLNIQVSNARVAEAKRLMSVAELESISLIHVRAGHMTAEGNPVKSIEPKERPSASAIVIASQHRFRVVVAHGLVGRGPQNAQEIQIDASFDLVYRYPEDIDPPTEVELQAFAETNALLNCWPYWRALVQDMVARMGLPPMVLPLFRLLPVGEKKEEKKEAVGASEAQAANKQEVPK
ncbi:MAG: hypothetical protein LAP21_24555 [Acidobacteriia bacterium]|nr:hypothetical protein [Terriglobia bacterium]